MIADIEPHVRTVLAPVSTFVTFGEHTARWGEGIPVECPDCLCDYISSCSHHYASSDVLLGYGQLSSSLPALSKCSKL